MFNKKVIQYDEPVYITVSKLFLDVDSPSKLFPHISEMFIDNDIQRPPCWGDDDRNEFIESLLITKEKNISRLLFLLVFCFFCSKNDNGINGSSTVVSCVI